MRLLEAIIDANHRALDGDARAGLHLSDYSASLPLVALTCIDPRLNRLFPGALALPEDNFVWLRNAGNIIFDPMSSMMRSLALACAVKGGKEIAVIGHTDCQVRHITQSELVQRFQTLGVSRQQMPEDIVDFFGIFSNERDNVVKSAAIVRQSPLIGPRVPVHGLIVDTSSGRLEWVVNGYDVLDRAPGPASLALPELGSGLADFSKIGSSPGGEIRFPDQKIGEIVTQVRQAADSAAESIKQKVESEQANSPSSSTPPVPPPIAKPVPIPPPISTRHTGSWRIKR